MLLSDKTVLAITGACIASILFTFAYYLDVLYGPGF